jgi:hypothetical protein
MMISSKWKLILKTLRSQDNHYCCLSPTSSFCNCIGDIIVGAIAPCAVDYWFETRSGKTMTIELSFVSSPIRTQH